MSLHHHLNKHILQVWLWLLGIMLTRKRGYDVETAASGDQAIQKAQEFSPHIIISDITMPGMDGFEMMGEMKSKDLAPFKSIALSGHELPKSQHRDSGYDAHLTKPVDFEVLFATIDRLTQPKDPRTESQGSAS